MTTRVMWHPEGKPVDVVPVTIDGKYLYAKTAAGLWWRLSEENDAGWRVPCCRVYDADRIEHFERKHAELTSPQRPIPPMQKIERTPPGCQYNIEVLSETVEAVTVTNATNLAALPKHAKWSRRHFAAPPPIGTRVNVLINGLGTGTVQGYFIEHGWVGVHVLPDRRPDWHIRNVPNENYYLVFGNEIAPSAPPLPTFSEEHCTGTFDGFNVTSDADPGL